MAAALRDRARSLLPKAHGCPLIVVANAAQFESDGLDVEFGDAAEVLASAQPLAPQKSSLLTLRELPAVTRRRCASVRPGSPTAVTAKIGRFVAANGDVLDGPSCELFLQPPDPERMHQSVVEMPFPVRRREAAPAERRLAHPCN